jgi:3-phenylpropionate/trans-cinnamate dioxygenase ferredoxin subunit
MARYTIAKRADIEDGRRLVIDVAGRSIGLIASNGEVFALKNICPHQQGPLCEGAVLPAHTASVTADGDVTEYLDYAQPVICCPWHGWEFDLRTGTCLADPTRRVATYPVTLDGDDVVIEIRD